MYQRLQPQVMRPAAGGGRAHTRARTHTHTHTYLQQVVAVGGALGLREGLAHVEVLATVLALRRYALQRGAHGLVSIPGILC